MLHLDVLPLVFFIDFALPSHFNKLSCVTEHFIVQSGVKPQWHVTLPVTMQLGRTSVPIHCTEPAIQEGFFSLRPRSCSD